MDFVGLSQYIDQKVSRLSGGQKQRVAIARALIKRPKIILADEPTGNLDSATANDIYKLFKQISKTCLTCIISHDIEAANLYADEIIIISDGIIKEKKKNENHKNNYVNLCIDGDSKLSLQRVFLKNCTESDVFKVVASTLSKAIECCNIESMAEFNVKLEKQEVTNTNTANSPSLSFEHSNLHASPIPMTYIDAIRFSFLGLKKRIGRSVLSIILLSILTLFSLISIGFLTYDSGKTLSSYQHSYKNPYLTLKTDTSYQDLFQQWHSVELRSGPFFLDKIYSVFDKNTITPVIGQNEIMSNDISLQSIKIAVINEYTDTSPLVIEGNIPQNKDEIVLSDFLVKRLNLTNEPIGKNVEVNGKKMVVTGVFHTDYEEYDIIRKINNAIASPYSDYKIYNEYNICLVSDLFIQGQKEEAKVLELPKSSLLFGDWESRYILSSFKYGSSEYVSTYDLSYGRMPNNEKEVLISENIAFNMQIDLDQGFHEIHGSYIDLYAKRYNHTYSNTLNMYNYFPEGYTIVGIYKTLNEQLEYEPDALIFSSVFHAIKDSFFETYQFEDCFVFTNAGIEPQKFTSLGLNEVYWTETSAKLIYKFETALHKLDIYIVLVLLICIIAIIILCVSLISYSIKDQSKMLGILRSLGFTQLDTLKIYIWEAIIMGVLGTTLSVIMLWLFVMFANYNYAHTLEEFPFILVFFKLQYLLIVLVSTPIISLISSFIPIFKLLQKKPYDLIYQS